jgi:nanoRNase/pAp phosphatase (c-di-AMP/oligoRNAs hydrolase)
LITRADLDGLACAVIIKEHEQIDEVLLIHPQEITDGEVDVTGDDILANVPYHEACAKWFDHHLLTNTNKTPPADFDGRFGYAPSAAELVWEYYGRQSRFAQMVVEANRVDAARLTMEDVLKPSDYVLLGFTLDSRSGLGHYESYFLELLDLLHGGMDIAEVLQQAEVQRRVEQLKEQDQAFRLIAKEFSRLEGNVVVTDYRSLDEAPAGNRFLIFVLFPRANVSMRVMWGPDRRFPVVACGHSIFNRTCRTNIGVLMSRYGGGGHVGAGSTPLPVDSAEQVIEEILDALREPAGVAAS